MKRLTHSLLLLELGVPGLVLTLGAMIIWGPAIFLAGLISLLGTRTFPRKAASAKGRVSDIYEVTPAEASDCLFPSLIVTVQFWTEQEESVEFQSHTFQGNPETVARSLPVLYDPIHPSEAKIRSFEGLWLTSGLVMVIGAGFSLIFTGLFVSVLR
jgi:hypothetical protein